MSALDPNATDRYSEFDSPKTLEAIAGSLRQGGHEVFLVEATEDLPTWLLSHPVDLAFNIAEGTHGKTRESQVPAILESLRIPFTGSGSRTLAITLDKAKTKTLLASEGFHTPAWQVFTSPATRLKPSLRFPLIVKPNREGSAKGIVRESVVWDEATLARQVCRVFERYHQEVLVEEFIEGIELTVGVLGSEDPLPLPILEIDFTPCKASGEFFYSWRMKEFQGNEALGLNPALHCPARLDPQTTECLQQLAVSVHRLLGCADLSRTDIRLRADGIPFILEVNPLPGLDPQDSNFPVMTTQAGFSHEALINRIVDLAIARAHQVCLTPQGLSAVPNGTAQAGAGREVVPTQEPSQASLVESGGRVP